MSKLMWPAPERNKGPILDILLQELSGSRSVLEISSGTGQHAVHFARNLPHLTWQPTDIDPDNLASIEAWRVETMLDNLLAPKHLDVLRRPWSVGRVDAVFNANMIHIAPWACAEGLLRGASEALRAGSQDGDDDGAAHDSAAHGAKLILYGPYKIGGRHTAPSNAEFDAGLRARDSSWGVRELDDVVALAAAVGLSLSSRTPMPANNQLLVFERS